MARSEQMRAAPIASRQSQAAAASPWLTNPAGQIWHTLVSVRFALVLILLILVLR